MLEIVIRATRESALFFVCLFVLRKEEKERMLEGKKCVWDKTLNFTPTNVACDRAYAGFREQWECSYFLLR